MEIPCPDCSGWMEPAGKRLRCPDCGRESDEELPEPTAAAAAIQAGPNPGVEAGPLPMARPPGPAKLRRFGICLLLGVVTVGIYFVYYQWQVFREVDADAGRRHHAALFVAALAAGLLAAGGDLALGKASPAWLDLVAPAGALLRASYLWLEAGQLREARARVGLPATAPRNALYAVTAAGALAGAAFPDGPGFLLSLAGLALAELFVYLALHQSIDAYWRRRRGGRAPDPPRLAGAAPA